MRPTRKLSQEQNDNEMPPWKQMKIAVEEMRSDLRGKVQDKIDTVIKFEIEHARKPKEEPKDEFLNESNSAGKLLNLEEPENEEYLEDDSDYDIENQDLENDMEVIGDEE